MSATEQVFTAKQVSERLGLSSAMTRRYGAALEQITGEPIRQHPRDGRQYRADQVEAMMRAKAFVEANARLSVAQALTLALGEAPVVATPAVAEGPGNMSQALSEALERTLLPELRALREEVVGLRADRDEVQALRAEVAELRAEVATQKALPPAASAERVDRVIELEMIENGAAPEQPAADTEGSTTAEIGGERDHGSTDDGLLVKTARWLERRLRGRG